MFAREEFANLQNRSWLALVPRAVRLAAETMRISARLLWVRWTLRKAIATVRRQPIEMIAKTWCFQPQPSTDGRDFYYGDLQQRLAQRGVRMLLLCGDVRADQWRAFVRGHAATGALPRLPELCLVPPWAPWRVMAGQVIAWWRLRRAAHQMKDAFMQALSHRASWECLTPQVLRTALGYWIGRTSVQWWRPRAFLMLYEGHSWERCAARGVRAAGTPCQIVNYQHTVLFRESLALTRACGDPQHAAFPDIVLGLGPVPIRLMQERHAPHGVRLLPFGSFRASGAVSETPADPRRRTVLVTPEGIRSEIEILFAFAAACAQRMPAYTFILRSHPEVPMAQALRYAPPGTAQLPNIVLSQQRRIEEDFEQASVLLYRGSSTVLYGIAKGLLPVFVQQAAAVDSDPLYALKTWHERVGSPEEVVDVLARYEGMEDAARMQAWRAGAQFVADYTGPVTDERLDAFLLAAGFNTEPTACAA